MKTKEIIKVTKLATNLGALHLASSGKGLLYLAFPDEEETMVRWIGKKIPGAEISKEPSANREASRQLGEYLAGERKVFDLELDLRGTPFQNAVWKTLAAIPWGRTATYGGIARKIGSPGASRAVGAANARNPIPIIIPCHRVIGKDGSLTGFGGGLDLKRKLLEIEGHTFPSPG